MMTRYPIHVQFIYEATNETLEVL